MCACFQGGGGATTRTLNLVSHEMLRGRVICVVVPLALAGETRDDVGVGADLALSFIAWCGLLRVLPGY